MIYQINKEDDKIVILKETENFLNEDKTLEIKDKTLNDLIKNKLNIGEFPILNQNLQYIESKQDTFYGIPTHNKNKIKIIKKELNLLESIFDKLVFIDYLDFMILHSKLASLGFFITDENKEEKYIEILESENEELLNDLEKYLELKEKIDQIIWKKNRFNELYEKIFHLKDDDPEVLKLL